MLKTERTKKRLPKVFFHTLKSMPKDKVLDFSKFRAFADNKIIVTQNFKFTLERVENIVGKGENAGYQHFRSFLFQSKELSQTWVNTFCW